MASIASLQTLFSKNFSRQSTLPDSPLFLASKVGNLKERRTLPVVAAVGDVSADGTAYLIAGAAAVALFGTAFPIVFSRKDT